MKYVINEQGKYVGAFDEQSCPESAITVPTAPLFATQLWVNGKWSDSTAEAEFQERLWRDSELDRADIELYKVQDSDPKAKGSVSGWREYRKALRAYPESEGFPNQESRPVAPDVA